MTVVAQSGPSAFFSGPDPVESISVFPNPAIDYIQLSGRSDRIRTIGIYSMVGRSVRQFQVNGEDRYYVADLPNGMYLIQMMDSNMQVVHTHRMNKRS